MGEMADMHMDQCFEYYMENPTDNNCRQGRGSSTSDPLHYHIKIKWEVEGKLEKHLIVRYKGAVLQIPHKIIKKKGKDTYVHKDIFFKILNKIKEDAKSPIEKAKDGCGADLDPSSTFSAMCGEVSKHREVEYCALCEKDITIAELKDQIKILEK